MKKKLFTLLLVVMVCGALTGCGLFTEKSETASESNVSKLRPVCEIELK